MCAQDILDMFHFSLSLSPDEPTHIAMVLIEYAAVINVCGICNAHFVALSFFLSFYLRW